MGELSEVERLGLRIPPGRMIRLGIFLAAFAYCFTCCLGSAQPPTPTLVAPHEDSNNNNIHKIRRMHHHSISDEGWNQNPNSYDEIKDKPKFNNEAEEVHEIRLEKLLRQDFVLISEERKRENSGEAVELNDNHNSNNVNWNDNNLIDSTVESARVNMGNDRKLDNDSQYIQQSNFSAEFVKVDQDGSNKTNNTPLHQNNEIISKGSDFISHFSISLNSPTSAEVGATTSETTPNNESSLQTTTLSDLIAQSTETEKDRVENNTTHEEKHNNPDVQYDSRKEFTSSQPNSLDSPLTNVESRSGTKLPESYKDLDSLKMLIQNTVTRMKTSLDEIYEKELKSRIRDFIDVDFNNDNNNNDNNNDNLKSENSSSEMYSWKESSYDDLADYDNNDNNGDNNDSSYELQDSEEDFNFFMDHLRELYDDHATNVVLRALETQTIPEDIEFWTNVSRFLDTPHTYLRRTKRRARRWKSRRYRNWQMRRRQQLMARMSITYSHVVPCAYRDRFYCLNGGTCVFVEALDIKTCRCPIGYTGVRCELIDREYILTLLTNQLIFS